MPRLRAFVRESVSSSGSIPSSTTWSLDLEGQRERLVSRARRPQPAARGSGAQRSAWGGARGRARFDSPPIIGRAVSAVRRSVHVAEGPQLLLENWAGGQGQGQGRTRGCPERARGRGRLRDAPPRRRGAPPGPPRGHEAHHRVRDPAQLAHQGTLFLDEITTIPTGIKQRLLALVETGNYTPLGASERRHVDSRRLLRRPSCSP